MQFLRQDEVLDRLGVSRTTLWEMRRRGEFPEPVQLTPKIIAWPESDLEDWADSLDRASTGPGPDNG